MRVERMRDSIPDIGTITTSAIRYAVCTQAISSVLADSPPWIWVNELVTIWTSMIAMNWPVPMAKMPIQSRSRGVASEAAAGRGSGGAVDGSLSAAAGLRRASAIPARPPRRSALARVIVDLRGSTKGPPSGFGTKTQSRTPEGLFQGKQGWQPSAEVAGGVAQHLTSGVKAAE